MMYGTVARLRPKTGQEESVVSLMKEWKDTRGRRARGFVGAYLYRPDDKPEELIMAVAFEDKESYETNADDPEQDRWYRRLLQHLEADPIWEDGQILSS